MVSVRIKNIDNKQWINIPAVQSMNHTSGYIATYLFISLVDSDSMTSIFVSLFRPKSFLNSIVLSIVDVGHGNEIVLDPDGLPLA
jgi:hypothetical protein